MLQTRRFVLFGKLLLLGILIGTGVVFHYVWIWSYQGPAVEFYIRPGEGFASINYRLAKRNLISHPSVFHHYCQYKNLLNRFKTGRYKIGKNSNMPRIIQTLVFGIPLGIELTIPEGKNIFEIAAMLEKKEIVSSKREFIKLAKASHMARMYNILGDRLEGYLYPNTYRFDKNTPPKKIIDAMIHVFDEKVKNIDFSVSNLSKNEVIILASIVEKETGASWERPVIAGVFHNRLRKGMLLQSDPTTIYGIFEKFNGNLRKRHLLEKTPYNTYKIKGLPRGPISNPGLASIKAVLYPKNHDYLYFVSRNDGTHVFSTNYKDHLKAVYKHQKIRKNRQGKSWRNLKQN